MDASTSEGAKEDAVVTTTKGPVRGEVGKDHRSFKGIPYAAAPVKDRRWKSPQPAKPWAKTRDATRAGNSCPQTGDTPISVESQNEDCLNLNVTTPRKSSGTKLPVVVFVHGGDFNSSAGSVFGGERLARTGDAIVVSMNYRLGAFGFLSSPALDGKRDKGASGNFGLEDQQAALTWVRDNAAAFGGDPGRVTLAGESAGAASVCSHLASPDSAGLFDGAIAQSGPCTEGQSELKPAAPRPKEEADAMGTEVARKLGCEDGDAACLREKSVPEVMKASDNGAGFGPVTGANILPTAPATAIRDGDFNRVPVMHGTNRDEHAFQLWGMEVQKGEPLDEKDYTKLARDTFGDEAERVMDEYPVGDYSTPGEAMSAMLTDYLWALPAVETDDALAERVPTYAYEFADDDAPFYKQAGGAKPSFPLGAYHSSEIPYLFDVDYAEGLDSSQKELSGAMTGYWTRFAANGDPNGGDAPDWPRYEPGDGHVQSLAPGNGGITRADFAKEHRVGFWRSLDL